MEHRRVVFKNTSGVWTEMKHSVHDAIADAVMSEYHSRWQVMYIAPEDVCVYGRTGADVSRIIRSIIDALRSPHLEGRIHTNADVIQSLQEFEDDIVEANGTTLDRFCRLQEFLAVISFIVFCELRSDNQKSQQHYGNGDDDRWGYSGLKGSHSERDSLVYEYIIQLFRLVCPLFCDLYLTCHGSDTILNKTEPIGIRGFELTETAVSPYPVLLDLVNLVKSGQFTEASDHMDNAFHDICEKMGRLDLYGEETQEEENVRKRFDEFNFLLDTSSL